MDRYRHPITRRADGRRADSRRRKLVLSKLIEQLGGEDALTPAQVVLIGQVEVKLTTLDELKEHVKQRASLLDADGQLAPSLRRSYLAFANSLRRDLETLHNLRGAKKKTPSLQDYLIGKRGAKP